MKNVELLYEELCNEYNELIQEQEDLQDEFFKLSAKTESNDNNIRKSNIRKKLIEEELSKYGKILNKHRF